MLPLTRIDGVAGGVFTVTVYEVELKHPNVSVPVTVYVVVLAGESVIVTVVCPPGCQT